MRKQDFQFNLPPECIATSPSLRRSDSRLMVVDPRQQSLEHHRFVDLLDFLRPDDCLIFNNTKVIPARLQAEKETGGKVEILLERVLPSNGHDRCLAQLRASNSPKTGCILKVGDALRFEVLGREANFFKLKSLACEPLLELIESLGQMPLPPYIERDVVAEDKTRYQTVYAKHKGAVAAPTAGLHFDDALMARIEDKGIAFDFVTLHVGAGTYSPLRVDNIRQHEMHSECFALPPSVVDLVDTTRANGGRVIAVGTTSVRCLESATKDGRLEPTRGETNIFIYPGYSFKQVDALITNFHLSESTLLMLVSAFAGRSFILDTYQQAIDQGYRFFSYGDSMFLQNRVPAKQSLA